METKLENREQDLSEKPNLKRRNEGGNYSTDEDEDFVGFDDFNGSASQSSLESLNATSEEAILHMYNNWDTVDKSKIRVNELLRKPFDFGWKRELVYRAVTGVSKEKGEVYYITPSGKKLRTKGEMAANLTDGLTLDNFTFTKSPLFIGPDHEIIRSAKSKSSPKRMPVVQQELVREGKRIPKPKVPKGASPPPSSAASRVSTPAAKPVPKTTPPSTQKKTPAQKQAKGEPCTMQCALAMGAIPQLQCSKCLCLYHHECVGIARDDATAGQYVCQGCGSATKSTVSSIKNGNGKAGSESPQTVAVIGGRTYIVVPKPLTSAQPDEPVPRKTGPKTVDSHRNMGAGDGFGIGPTSGTNFIRDAASGYNVLLQVFQYLNVKELLRASRVCRLFNQLANRPCLWHTVRMKNSQVNDWAGFARALRSNGTKHLDLRKMLISADTNETWECFLRHIGSVEELESIELCRCPAFVVQRLFQTNKRLRIMNALLINDDKLNLANVRHISHQLTELRLRPENWFEMQHSLSPLKSLIGLRHLVLTFFKHLDEQDVDVIGNLTNLESLEIGECSRITGILSFSVLPKLTKLTRLRMEKGQENCDTTRLLRVVAGMPSLVQLELVNFDIVSGFDVDIGECVQIRRLLIIPTYISQSATTNLMVLKGVMRLVDLASFTWVVTNELLRVTDLYVNQCEKISSEQASDESIPILKPVPGHSEESAEADNPDVQQVEIVALSKVEKILNDHLPNTFIRIVKTNLSSTWRLTLVDNAV